MTRAVQGLDDDRAAAEAWFRAMTEKAEQRFAGLRPRRVDAMVLEDIEL